MYKIGTKNVVKAVKKVAQGPARDKGKTWFIQLKDKRKYVVAHSIIRSRELCDRGWCIYTQGCMQKFCNRGEELGVFKKEGAHLQAASGRALEDYVKN